MRYNGLGIVALMLAFSVIPARANLITDPGFESCTTSGTAAPGWTAHFLSDCGTNPNTGSWDNDFPDAGGLLSQTITTVVGDTYDFSFWLENNAITPSDFIAQFGSNQVLILTSPAAFGYTLEEFRVTASSTSSLILFSTAGNGGAWSLDDVSVTEAPEPASLVLLATGLLTIAWRFRRGTRGLSA